jgi:hypothetical protein
MARGWNSKQACTRTPWSFARTCTVFGPSPPSSHKAVTVAFDLPDPKAIKNEPTFAFCEGTYSDETPRRFADPLVKSPCGRSSPKVSPLAGRRGPW